MFALIFRGIGSCIFTQNGEAFYLSSSSEFSRFSISARNITTPMCLIQMSNESISANESVVSKRSPENSQNSSANRSPLERFLITLQFFYVHESHTVISL